MVKDQTSLQQRRKEWIDIVNHGDVEAYAELLAKVAVWFPPVGVPIEGRTAFKKMAGNRCSIAELLLYYGTGKKKNGLLSVILTIRICE